MSYNILILNGNNDQSQELISNLSARGCNITKSVDKADNIDMLIVYVPHPDNSNRGKSISDDLDFEELSKGLSIHVSSLLESVKAAIPLFNKDGLKRIALITDKYSSIRESCETEDYAYHMLEAAANMMMKLLFNIYKPEGFTFRCYADSKEGIPASEYLLTDQSYIETDAYIHSDENRLVMRDGLLREISW